MKIRTQIKAGYRGMETQHNEALRVRSTVKAGIIIIGGRR